MKHSSRDIEIISSMLLYEFLNLSCNKQQLIEYLQRMEVIRREITCPQCHNVINVTYDSDVNIFQCTNKYYKQIQGRKRVRKTCNFKISILHGTWFNRGHLGLVKACRFIAYFLYMRPPRYDFLMQELEISQHTVVDWTNFCREVNIVD